MAGIADRDLTPAIQEEACVCNQISDAEHGDGQIRAETEHCATAAVPEPGADEGSATDGGGRC